MIYVYDLLLNFQDVDRLVEFFEWSDDDLLEHIKKIPLFRINSIDMDNICYGTVKFDSTFLEKIKFKTLLYKKKKTITYAALFCDLNRTVAVEISKQGEVIAKSCLLLDEEGDVIDSSQDLDIFDISYKVLKKEEDVSFLTRSEEFQQKYLYQEFKSLFEKKDVDKLTYLYEEVFGHDDSLFDYKYERLLDGLSHSFDRRYQNLYEVVRLSYSKK